LGGKRGDWNAVTSNGCDARAPWVCGAGCPASAGCEARCARGEPPCVEGTGVRSPISATGVVTIE
jgi:hypothetical protein